ncbi:MULTISPECIES: hypothetical protein [unclassified Luteibacter]|uniref:hypothetical protein n=1 Tax=Luteibacter sp. PvP019 TaxID=3156436 RepID=UPI003390A82A
MMLVLGLAALGAAGVFAVVRRTPSPPARPAAARPRPLGAWRAAASESPTLRLAVDAMHSHTDLIRQMADGWLLSANQNVREPDTFCANVQRSEELAGRLEDECIAVIAELRELEQKRDRVGLYDLRREQALQVATWADSVNRVLRARVVELAQTQGVRPEDLITAGAKTASPVTMAKVEALMTRPADRGPPSLKDLLA